MFSSRRDVKEFRESGLRDHRSSISTNRIFFISLKGMFFIKRKRLFMVRYSSNIGEYLSIIFRPVFKIFEFKSSISDREEFNVSNLFLNFWISYSYIALRANSEINEPNFLHNPSKIFNIKCPGKALSP
jgi:hypothetical protein